MFGQVPDEEEIRSKTKQIADEYEKRMQKMAAELEEARASSERTAVEMGKLRTEAKATQQKLHADFAAQAEKQRAQLKLQFDAEMERVQQELESTRRSKDAVQAEMDSVRHQYEAAVLSLENSVPPQQLDAERERLKSEYEASMKVMRDELETVKTSRANMESQVENLRAAYEANFSTGRSPPMVSHSSTTTDFLSTASSHEVRRQNLTDEMKIVSAENVNCCQTDKSGNVTSGGGEQQQQTCSDVIGDDQSKHSLQKYSSDCDQETKVDNKVPKPSSSDVEQLERDVAVNHESAVAKINAELEDFKRSRDNLAKIIYNIKTEYQGAVWYAEETVPGHRFDVEKLEIREKYELPMNRVKDDLQVLKSHRDIVTRQLGEQTSAWKKYEEEQQVVRKDVEAGRVHRDFGPELIRAAAERYFEETRRLWSRAAADKINVETRVIDDRFERENQRIWDDVGDDKMTEKEAEYQVEQLIKARTADLAAIHKQVDGLVLPVADYASETNENRKASSIPRSQSRTGARSAQRGKAGVDAAKQRLKTLENILIQGGRDVTGGDGGNPDATEHCRVIREKLLCKRLNAEEKQRQVEEAHKMNTETDDSSTTFASSDDELRVKTMALHQVKRHNQNLHREISDLQVLSIVLSSLTRIECL